MSDDARLALSGWGMIRLAAARAVVIAIPVGIGTLARRASAQTPWPRRPSIPTYEVASIKPNKSGDARVGMLAEPGGLFTATNITPAMLIRQAYRLQGAPFAGSGGDSLVVDAPAWVHSDRFDIVAKADATVTANQLSEASDQVPAGRPVQARGAHGRPGAANLCTRPGEERRHAGSTVSAGGDRLRGARRGTRTRPGARRCGRFARSSRQRRARTGEARAVRRHLRQGTGHRVA